MLTGIAAVLPALLSAPVAAQESLASELPAIPAPPAGAGLPEIEPVIPDAEFDDLVPEFDPGSDPELDRPLETIEEFERRLADEAAAATATGNGEGQVAVERLNDGIEQEEIADAPLGDPELLAPLEPLDSFVAEPVVVAREDTAPAAEVRYHVELEGLDEADEQTDISLRDLFAEHSTLEEGDGRAANSSQVYARLRDDAELLRTVLESEGWYDPSITTRIEAAPDGQAGALLALLQTEPGKRFTFGRIAIEAERTQPEGLIEKYLSLRPGEPIVAQRVEAAEAQVGLMLTREGYPFATVGERDILLDRATATGDYTLPVDVGPKARFGSIRSIGKEAFDARHIAVLARFERGELYDSRDMDDLNKALVATGLFSAVSARPVRTGEDAGDGTEYVDIEVDQQAGPPRTIAARVGYATGQGFRAEGSWTHRNLFPPEGALIVSGSLGTQEQGVRVTFKRSNAGRRDRTFQLSAEALRSDYAAIDAYTGRLAVLWSYDSTPIWRKTLTYAYGGQVLVSAEDDYDLLLAEQRRRTFYIAGLSGEVGLDFTDDLLDPAKGFRVKALVEPEASIEDGFAPYARARIDASGYLPIGEKLVIAGRIGLGTIQGIDRFDLAPSRRFYSGGGGSVRGFGYQTLGPQVPVPNPDYDPSDPDENDPEFINRPLGGRSFNEASAEVRYRFGDFGVAAFVDAGQAYESTFPEFSDLRFGVGVGVRYYTNFGPMRIDVATPLNRRPGEEWLNVYVSIGQAF